MSDFAVKKRLKRAIEAAKEILENPILGCTVICLNNHVFHLEAIREKEIRKIRITFDEITDEDIRIVKEIKLPEICTKEIWCRKEGKNFDVKKVD